MGSGVFDKEIKKFIFDLVLIFFLLFIAIYFLHFFLFDKVGSSYFKSINTFISFHIIFLVAKVIDFFHLAQRFRFEMCSKTFLLNVFKQFSSFVRNFLFALVNKILWPFRDFFEINNILIFILFFILSKKIRSFFISLFFNF
jgi:hypothetical protein